MSFSLSGRVSWSATHIIVPLPMEIFPQILPQLAYFLTWCSTAVTPRRSSTPYSIAICFLHDTSSLSDMALFIYLLPNLLSVSPTSIWAPEDRDFLFSSCVSREPRPGRATEGAQCCVSIKSTGFSDDWILSSQAAHDLRPKIGSEFSWHLPHVVKPGIKTCSIKPGLADFYDLEVEPY